jgi:hypothetical protein
MSSLPTASTLLLIIFTTDVASVGLPSHLACISSDFLLFKNHFTSTHGVEVATSYAFCICVCKLGDHSNLLLEKSRVQSVLTFILSLLYNSSIIGFCAFLRSVMLFSFSIS